MLTVGGRMLRYLLLAVLVLVLLQYLYSYIFLRGRFSEILIINDSSIINHYLESKITDNSAKHIDEDLQNTNEAITAIDDTDDQTFPNDLTNEAKVEISEEDSLSIKISKCETPTYLGPIKVSKIPISMEKIEQRFPRLRMGGLYMPDGCKPRYKVAIIIPFRNRYQHLLVFLCHMHKFLPTQNIFYGIFVIEQYGKKLMNRAKLKNVGFVLANQLLRSENWDCFVFHDIDLLPMDTRISYTCPDQPLHMSTNIDGVSYMDLSIFGGVTAVRYEQFVHLNGFSNRYWGWGGEDNDMFIRIRVKGYRLIKNPKSIGKYTALKHKKEKPSPTRFKLLHNASKQISLDGLSSLKYKFLNVTLHHLFISALVDIDSES